jgi:predicted RNase H-like HicB family nuclease
MNSYLAMIRTGEDQGFTIEFPDLPGCFAAALNFHEAMNLSRILLPQHLMELQLQGLPFPEPRNMNELRDSGLADGAVPVLIPVNQDAWPMDDLATGT